MCLSFLWKGQGVFPVATFDLCGEIVDGASTWIADCGRSVDFHMSLFGPGCERCSSRAKRSCAVREARGDGACTLVGHVPRPRLRRCPAIFLGVSRISRLIRRRPQSALSLLVDRSNSRWTVGIATQTRRDASVRDPIRVRTSKCTFVYFIFSSLMVVILLLVFIANLKVFP